MGKIPIYNLIIMQSKHKSNEIRSIYKPIACVFGSSTCESNSLLYKLAEDLGEVLVRNKFTIASGGYSGIMDGISKAGSRMNGRVLGITTDEITKVKPSRYLSQEFKENTLITRLDLLTDITDIFIFLPGSTGTLTELALVWDKTKLNLLPQRPIILFGKKWHKIYNLMFKEPDKLVPSSKWKKDKETAKITQLCNSIDDVDLILSNLT